MMPYSSSNIRNGSFSNYMGANTSNLLTSWFPAVSKQTVK